MNLLHAFTKPMLAIVDESTPIGLLRSAKATRAARQREVEAAIANVVRLEAMLAERDDAVRCFAQQQEAHSTAHAEWGKSGCDPTGAGDVQALADAVLEAARVVDRKKSIAEAAAKGLPPARSALESSESNLRSAERAVITAAAAVLIDEAAPEIAQFVSAAAEFRKARLNIQAIAEVTYPWSTSRDGVRADERVYAVISRALQDGELGPCNGAIDRYATSRHPLLDQLLKREARWRARADELCAE